MSSKTRTRPFDTEQARALLVQGCAQLNIAPSTEQIEQLIAYLQLMSKWNPVYNLTAIRDTACMVSHHLLDSLAIVPIFEKHLSEHTLSANHPKILDVGTGGGLPGIVLAVMHPDWQLTLIDPVHKKTAFLTQVKAQLTLTNVTVITGKVEDLQLTESQHFDIITSRAFASIHDFVQLSHSALTRDGSFFAMKGVSPSDEITQFATAFPQFCVAHSHALLVPQLNAERHLIHIQPLQT